MFNKTYHIENIESSNINFLEQICKLEEENFTSSWNLEQFSKALKSGTVLIFAAIEELSVHSYLVLQCIPNIKMLKEGELEVINIATSHKQRRKGLAQKLLEFAIEFAKNENVEKIFLDVRESNYSALTLYKKLNFEEVGRRKKYYTTENGKEDAILMTYHI